MRVRQHRGDVVSRRPRIRERGRRHQPSLGRGLGSIPAPVVWGALGISVIAAVAYFWPSREVRMT